MSVALQYPGAGVDLSQLHDELIRVALTPEYIGQGDLVTDEGLPTETRVDTVFLTMPDGTSEAAVDAIVAAHQPQARYDPATLLRERTPLLRENRHRAAWRRLEAQAAGATTLEALRLAVVALVQEQAARDREGAETT
jgi:hypothetical protein